MAMSNKKGKLFTEINITPLTDIFLVLLIIMMVLAPSFQTADNQINMPEINSGINIEDKTVTVSITKEPMFYLNDTRIEPDNLEAELVKLLPESKEKSVMVKADAAVKNSEIMKIMHAAQASGFEKLTIAGEPLSKKQQRELEKKNMTRGEE